MLIQATSQLVGFMVSFLAIRILLAIVDVALNSASKDQRHPQSLVCHVMFDVYNQFVVLMS